MTDTIKILGQQVGDDYSEINAAIAAIPSSVVSAGDRWIIEVRNDSTYTTSNNKVLPITEYDVIFRAFAGDEVNGKGEGAALHGTGTSGYGAFRLKGKSFSFHKLALLTTSGPYLYGNGFYASEYIHVKDCFIRASSSGVTLANGYTADGLIENTIIADCGNHGYGAGNTEGTLELKQVTFVNNVNGGVNQGSTGTGSVPATNCLSIGNALDFNGVSGDYNASGDLSAIGATVFTGRVITDDLEDPYGTTPDYNLKATSTLKGAGLNGSDIGATLGLVSQEITLISAALTLPGITTSATTEHTLPVYNALASAALPGITASAITEHNLPYYSTLVSATLPGITTSATTEHTLPVYNALASAALPGITASAITEHNLPYYSALASATLPGITASAITEHNLPYYSALVSATLPGITASAITEHTLPAYSALVSIEMPGIIASATVEHTLQAYQASASILLPGITAVISYGGSAIGYGSIIVLQELSSSITLIDHNQPLTLKG